MKLEIVASQKSHMHGQLPQVSALSLSASCSAVNKNNIIMNACRCTTTGTRSLIISDQHNISFDPLECELIEGLLHE